MMAIEIEKKYRLTKQQRQAVLRRLRETKAKPRGEVFEENTLYRGRGLDLVRGVLRLRRTGSQAVLTYKEERHSPSSVKKRQEDETRIADPDALDAILRALGFEVALVYEKRRATFQLGSAEVTIDELPFGLFMEIEADEDEIARVEGLIGATGLLVERLSYPRLTMEHGRRRQGVIEARFQTKKSGKA
jgi:adenylate cyclase, class 2